MVLKINAGCSESRFSLKGFSLGSDSSSISKSKFDLSLIRSVMVGQVMQWLFISIGTFTGLLKSTIEPPGNIESFAVLCLQDPP